MLSLMQVVSLMIDEFQVDTFLTPILNDYSKVISEWKCYKIRHIFIEGNKIADKL